MGSYCSYYITANNPPEIENDIIAFANKHSAFKDYGPPFEKWCWNKFSESSKWYPETFMRDLSLAFPKLFFKVKCTGDYTSTEYWHNGQYAAEEEIWPNPKFPTAPAFNKAIKMRKEKQAKAAKAKKEKEIQELKVKLASLEEEKKKLQNKLGLNI